MALILRTSAYHLQVIRYARKWKKWQIVTSFHLITKTFTHSGIECNAICADHNIIYPWWQHISSLQEKMSKQTSSENYLHDPIACPRCPSHVRRTCPAHVPWRCAQIHQRREQHHHQMPPSAGTLIPLSDSLSWTWWLLRCLNTNTDVNKNRFNNIFVESNGCLQFTLAFVSLHCKLLYFTAHHFFPSLHFGFSLKTALHFIALDLTSLLSLHFTSSLHCASLLHCTFLFFTAPHYNARHFFF